MKTVKSILPEPCVSFCQCFLALEEHTLTSVPSVQNEDSSVWSHVRTVHFGRNRGGREGSQKSVSID